MKTNKMADRYLNTNSNFVMLIINNHAMLLVHLYTNCTRHCVITYAYKFSYLDELNVCFLYMMQVLPFTTRKQWQRVLNIAGEMIKYRYLVYLHIYNNDNEFFFLIIEDNIAILFYFRGLA